MNEKRKRLVIGIGILSIILLVSIILSVFSKKVQSQSERALQQEQNIPDWMKQEDQYAMINRQYVYYFKDNTTYRYDIYNKETLKIADKVKRMPDIINNKMYYLDLQETLWECGIDGEQKQVVVDRMDVVSNDEVIVDYIVDGEEIFFLTHKTFSSTQMKVVAYHKTTNENRVVYTKNIDDGMYQECYPSQLVHMYENNLYIEVNHGCAYASQIDVLDVEKGTIVGIQGLQEGKSEWGELVEVNESGAYYARTYSDWVGPNGEKEVVASSLSIVQPNQLNGLTILDPLVPFEVQEDYTYYIENNDLYSVKYNGANRKKLVEGVEDILQKAEKDILYKQGNKLVLLDLKTFENMVLDTEAQNLLKYEDSILIQREEEQKVQLKVALEDTTLQPLTGMAVLHHLLKEEVY